MNRLFGDMRQIGYIVTDLQSSMRHWVNICAIDPWFWFEKSSYIIYKYKAKVYDGLDITVGFANSGDIRCKTPSMYRDFLAKYPNGGMQTWSSWPVEYRERYEAALKSGYTIGMEGDHSRGPFVYFDEKNGETRYRHRNGRVNGGSEGIFRHGTRRGHRLGWPRSHPQTVDSQ